MNDNDVTVEVLYVGDIASANKSNRSTDTSMRVNYSDHEMIAAHIIIHDKRRRVNVV